LLKNGAEPRDIAVITRTNRYISTNLEPAFVENGIPYLIQGSKTKKMTDKSEILYIINCLQLMVAPPRAQVYIAKQILIHMEGIGEKTAQEFSRILESGIFNLIEANPRKGESIIGLLKFILSESLKGLDGSKLGSYIETFLNYSKFDIKDRYLQEIKQLFSNWCEIYMEDMDRTLEQIIPDIQTAIDSVDEDTSNSVRLTTIHAVKGLEYDHVIACGFTYRTQNMVKLNEEELNMFYVQISRAIKSVMIVYSDFVKYMGEEEQGYKSKWLVKLLQYLNR
jgi:superfamily I DNA/RNA helicase